MFIYRLPASSTNLYEAKFLAKWNKFRCMKLMWPTKANLAVRDQFG